MNIEPERADLAFGGWDSAVCESAGEYRQRRPEESILYGVVAGHVETFLARQRERDRLVPRFVEREFRFFLDCGILAREFLRVHCDACCLDRLVPYSCKCRGFCPSCVVIDDRTDGPQDAKKGSVRQRFQSLSVIRASDVGLSPEIRPSSPLPQRGEADRPGRLFR
jgi:hypothetical protein